MMKFTLHGLILGALTGCALLAGVAVANAQDNSNLAASSDGTIYSVTSRYSNRTEYTHVSKMDAEGTVLWSRDYSAETSVKPIGTAINSSGAVILLAREIGRAHV